MPNSCILLTLLAAELDLQRLLGTVAQHVFQLLLTGDHGAALGTLTVELNGVELALGESITATIS